MIQKRLEPIGFSFIRGSFFLVGYCFLFTQTCAQENSPISTRIAQSTELENYNGNFAAVAWSTDGKQLVTASLKGESFQWEAVEYRVWNTDSMSLAAAHEIETLPKLLSLALSDSGEQIAVASSKNDKSQINLLNTEQDSVVESFPVDGSVSGLAFSPDGQFLLMGQDKIVAKPLGQGEPSVWDEPHELPISSLNYSRDGKRVASGSGIFAIICGEGVGNIERGEVMIHDATNGRLITQLKDPDKPAFALGVSALSLSPDGTQLATVNSSVVRIWDVDTGKLECRLNIPEHKTDLYRKRPLVVRAVSFSPNGNQLAVGVGNEVDVWDVAEKQIIARLRWHRKTVTAIAFSHDGHCLATAGGGVKVWDLRPHSPPLQLTAELQHRLTGHNSWVNSVAFSPEGSSLASGAGNELRFWNPIEGTLVSNHNRAIRGSPRDEILDLKFHHNGRLIVTGGPQNGPGITGWWNLEKQALEGSIEAEEQLQKTCVTPDGETIITATYKKVRFVDRKTGNELGSISVRDGAAPYTMALSPDGKTLATGAPYVQFWDVETQDRIWKIDDFYADAITFSPDGKSVAIGGDNRRIEIWDVEETCLIGQFNTLDSVRSLAFSPDGRLLASGASNSGRIRLWHTSFSQPIASPWTNEVALIEDDREHVLSLTFSPDGDTLASGGASGLVKLWSLSVESKKSD